MCKGMSRNSRIRSAIRRNMYFHGCRYSPGREMIASELNIRSSDSDIDGEDTSPQHNDGKRIKYCLFCTKLQTGTNRNGYIECVSKFNVLWFSK